MNLAMEIIGWVGMSNILIGFFMVQRNRWAGDGYQYNAVNFFGSVLLIAYSIHTGSMPFVALNAVWFLVSIRGLYVAHQKSLVKTKK